MVSGRNFISFKLACMSLSPARIKMIQSKMKGLEWLQKFSNYKAKEIFPDAQGQLTRSPWSDLAEFRTHSRCNECPCYLQE